MNVLVSSLSLGGLLVLSALFSAAETALFSLSKMERRRLKESHPKLSPWVFFHLEHPRQALAAVLIGNLFVNVLATALVTLLALEFLGRDWSGVLVAAFSVILILFCEIIPKVWAVHKNETLSLAFAVPLRIFSTVIYPVRRVTRWVTDWILKMIIKEKREISESISAEELRALVKIGEEEGLLDRQERHMIQKIFRMGEQHVKDIMTPRVEVRGLDVEDPSSQHLALMKAYHHRHFPVYKGSLDNVLGVISVQDYMLSDKKDLTGLLKQPLFVPETKRIDDLLSELRNQKQTFAVCVDEYGGTAGIVTLEDILEEIFGEFYDEYAQVENPIHAAGPHEYSVEAKIPLAAFNEHFSLELEAREASTLGGFILERLGTVPKKGDVLKLPECEIRVQEVLRQRSIRSVLVKFFT